MRISDANIKTFTNAIAATPTKQINDTNVVQLLAAVADKSGLSSATALTQLNRAGMGRQQQFDLALAGLSAREKTDLVEILDKGGFQFTPGAKNFLEALVGRAAFIATEAGGTTTTPTTPSPTGPLTLKGQEIKPEDKIVSTPSHNIQLATVVGGQALPDLRLSRRTIGDPEQKSVIVDTAAITAMSLSTITKAADFKVQVTALLATHKAFLAPDKTALLAKLPADDKSNYAVLNITGRRLEQFFGEVQRLIGASGMSAAEQKLARVDVNASFRDAFRGRTAEFDRADTGGYWSYGHDAAFVHVFEKMRDSLPETDPKRKFVQAQIDFIFTNKYVPNGKVDENDAEETMGLVAIDKNSRHVVSMTKGSETANRVGYETLQMPASGPNAGRFAYRDGTQFFFEGTRTEIPAADAAKLKSTSVTTENLVFRRAASTEQLRADFRYDWDGNGMLNTQTIDTGWWGHCDIKALIETVLADMKGSAGVSEYRSDTKRVTEFTRDQQLEGLAALLNFDDVYQSASTGGGRMSFGTTNFAGARFDNRPTVMGLKTTSSTMNLPIRLTDLSEKGDSSKAIDMNKIFAAKVADAKSESFSANKDLLRIDQGDMHVVDGAGRKIEGTTDGYSFDARGWPVETKTVFEIDLNATAGAKVIIGTELSDVDTRRLVRYYYDPATKDVSRVDTQFVLKAGTTTYEAVEGRSSPMGKLTGVELSREMEAGDDVKNKLKMLEDAVRTGGKIATDSDTRDQVWNGEVHAVRFNTEWRSADGKYERVSVNVDATFGNGKVGTFLHQLDDEGNVIDSMELKAAVDFYWMDQPRIAPLISERGNWYVNEGMLSRGVVDLGAGKAASLGALQDLNDLIYLGLKAKDNQKIYTIVHQGKRLVYANKTDWDADILKLKAAEAGTAGPVGPTTPVNPAKVQQTSKPNLTVPDNDPNGITDTINVSTSGVLKDIKVKVDLRHTYVGDLDVKLIAPNGTEVKLHARGGRGNHDLVGVYGLDLHAVDDLKKLAGAQVQGDWKLKIVDLAGQDVGNLAEWALDIDV
ncbi:MAG: proprotein convertase P-domain-containing protein [Deltaproteobacteria bacterium]|nr:proprotein convertase P-domain-containing protein [Deltaproteobacteria bacterium]